MDKTLENILMDSIGTPNRRFSRPPSRNNATTSVIEEFSANTNEATNIVNKRHIDIHSCTSESKIIPTIVMPSVPSIPVPMDTLPPENVVQVEVLHPSGEQSLVTAHPLATIPNQIYEEILNPSDIRPGDIAILEYPSLIPKPPENYHPILRNHVNSRIPVIKKAVRFQHVAIEHLSTKIDESPEPKLGRRKSRIQSNEVHPKLMLTSKGIFSERKFAIY
jgi:hypothetical protein